MKLSYLINGYIGGVSSTATQTFVAATSTPSQDIGGCSTIAAQVNVTSVTLPANTTWGAGNVSGNVITITAHGYLTGTAVTLTTNGGLPTGLATSTTYYVIALTANTLSFASSLANAQAGTAITLSSAGSGTGTVVVTALVGATAKLRKSLDQTNWFDEGAAQNITAVGALIFPKVDPECRYYRVDFAITSGQVTCATTILGKGPSS